MAQKTDTWGAQHLIRKHRKNQHGFFSLKPHNHPNKRSFNAKSNFKCHLGSLTVKVSLPSAHLSKHPHTQPTNTIIRKRRRRLSQRLMASNLRFLCIWFSDNLIRNARGRSLNEYVFNSHHNLVNKLRDSLGAVRARFFLSDVCFMLWSFGGD